MFEPPSFFCGVGFARQITQIAAFAMIATPGSGIMRGHGRFRIEVRHGRFRPRRRPRGHFHRPTHQARRPKHLCTPSIHLPPLTIAPTGHPYPTSPSTPPHCRAPRSAPTRLYGVHTGSAVTVWHLAVAPGGSEERRPGGGVGFRRPATWPSVLGVGTGPEAHIPSTLGANIWGGARISRWRKGGPASSAVSGYPASRRHC